MHRTLSKARGAQQFLQSMERKANSREGSRFRSTSKVIDDLAGHADTLNDVLTSVEADLAEGDWHIAYTKIISFRVEE